MATENSVDTTSAVSVLFERYVRQMAAWRGWMKDGQEREIITAFVEKLAKSNAEGGDEFQS